MAGRTPTCVWRIGADLVLALDDRLGAPLDSYVNGSQVWLADDGPGGTALEWRLHPVAGYVTQEGCSHYDLWETVVDALRGGADDAALHLGEEVRPLHSLWDGLECFPPHDPALEPARVAAAAGERLGRGPDAAGLVDHVRIGEAWERAGGGVSLVGLLLDELHA